jgi:hypothetical protein
VTFAILYAQAMFVAGMLKSRCRHEADILFSAGSKERMPPPANLV